MDGENPKQNVKIFGNRTGYIHRQKEMKTPANPLRIRRNPATPKADSRVVIYTDGSTTRNGWDNSMAGIGNWHEEGSFRNVALKLEGNAQTNQRAELAAILAALRHNSSDDLLIYSDSLTSISIICYELQKYEDKGWYGVKNKDILMQIMEELRTREGTCEFQWVKAHRDNEGNNMADKMADEGRLSDDAFILIETNSNNSRAIHDGARLSALEMKDIYAILTTIMTKEKGNIKHPERLEEARYKLLEHTGLLPTPETIIQGTWRLPTYPKARDHIWNMLTGRIKIGTYWNHVPGFEERALCVACLQSEEREVTEDETHLWTECNHNGQKEAWKVAEQIWKKTTRIAWPKPSLELIRGIGGITLTDREEKPLKTNDTSRLKILVTATTWAIWKARNKRSISGINTPKAYASQLMREHLNDLTRKLCEKTDRFKGKLSKKQERTNKLWTSIANATAQGGLPHEEL